MNRRRETVEMNVPPGNRPAVPRDWFRGVPEWYVAGSDTRGRPEGRLYPRSQQAIHETSRQVKSGNIFPFFRELSYTLSLILLSQYLDKYE